MPFLPALRNPAATADQQASQANQVKAMYATLTPEQLAIQSRLALEGMITDPAHVERVATWGNLSAPQAVGIAMAEMLTTDLRDQAQSIDVPVLLVRLICDPPDYPGASGGWSRATIVGTERLRNEEEVRANIRTKCESQPR